MINFFQVGEPANVVIGLKQRISGIEMAVTNCTVFDEDHEHRSVVTVSNLRKMWQQKCTSFEKSTN